MPTWTVTCAIIIEIAVSIIKINISPFVSSTQVPSAAFRLAQPRYHLHRTSGYHLFLTSMLTSYRPQLLQLMPETVFPER